MSSEFSCDYCSNMPRRPCHSRGEASSCPNADRGRFHDFTARQVVEWLRYTAPSNGAVLLAAEIIEENEHFL